MPLVKYFILIYIYIKLQYKKYVSIQIHQS